MLKKILDLIGLWKRRLPFLVVQHDTGDRSKPTIVFLHGIGASSSAWDPLLEEMGDELKHYRVLTLDLMGFGASPDTKYTDYSVDHHVAAIRKTLKKHNVRTPFTLVGHSMGSIISAHYCSRYPNEVSQALLVSLPLYLTDTYSKGFLSKESNKGYKDFYEYVRSNPEFSMKIIQQAQQFGADFGMDTSAQYKRALSLSLKNTIENQSTYTDILNTDVPITEIHGNLDGLLIPMNLKQLDKIKHVKVVIARGAGHKITKPYAKKIKKELITLLNSGNKDQK